MPHLAFRRCVHFAVCISLCAESDGVWPLLMTVTGDITGEGDHIVIRRHRSRFDGVTGTVPGFTEAVDVEASRDGWD